MNNDPTALPGDDRDDLPDPALGRALAHAPDHSAVPDFRIGKSIRRMAHEAVGGEAAQDLLPMLPDAQPWWRRLLFGNAGNARMPWNAAFATVLVGVLVTVMWQREPVPSPRLDTQAPAARPAAPAPAPAQAPAAAAPTEAPAIALPPTVNEAPALPGPRTPPVVPQLPFQLELPPPPPPSAAAQRKESRAELADDAERKRMTPLPVPMPPPSPARAAAPAAPSAALGSAAPPAAQADAASPPQPGFSALSQWTRMTVVPTGGGQSRSFTRAEARDLGALVGSAALSAINASPLRSKVEWRVTFERDGKPIAQFELARGEVRWRETGTASATGQPPEGALDGLRDALRDVTAPPAATAEPAAAAPMPVAPEPAPPEAPR